MEDISEREYKRRIRAWTLYDWANSAFATTILAAVLPVYYSTVTNLASAATATAYWTTTLAISLAIVALIAPVLGTMADVMRGKKRFLAIFTGIGILGTSLLAFVGTGDWLLASVVFIVGRVGFAAANVFYDSLLPHVARSEDQDRVSAMGYAIGYLGGGLLLAVNVVMIKLLPGTWGPRLSFVSVGAWWLVFSIPLFRRVPEPPSAQAPPGRNVLLASFKRLGQTLGSIRKYRQLFRFLIAFLIYNDGIGTIISVAVIYVTELRIGAASAILAVLLIQFVGIPFALIFGRIPGAGRKAGFLLSLVVFNLVTLPVTGIGLARLAPFDVTGVVPPTREERILQDDGSVEFRFYGSEAHILNWAGEGAASWRVTFDGVDRFGTLIEDGNLIIGPAEGGDHVLRLTPIGPESDPALLEFEVVPGDRESNLLLILGALFALQAVGVLFSLAIGRRIFAGLAARMQAKSTIVLALVTYAVIAVWGFFLDSVVEFWFLAFMVAVVQGGSQALSRSLYAAMSPKALSGEFFALFSVMAKFSAILGPIVFAQVALAFDNSRPAVLAIVAFFVVGIVILLTVDVEEGRRVAKKADAELLTDD